MIRVGFIGAVSKEWMGGLNYFKNLLYAISILENKEIEPIVFVGKKTDEDIKAMFRKYAQVIEHSMFDRKSLSWFYWKIPQRIFKTHYALDQLLKQYHIDVLSHTDIINLKSCKTINWIPDFQHLHLPHMFSSAEIKHRDIHFLKLAQYSDAIVLSSFDALKDFNSFAPQYIQKAKVLQFVSQPDSRYKDLSNDDEDRIRKVYDIDVPFFYLPNQFWAHKNHQVVFEAIKILKDNGHDIYVVCTGYMNDYRNTKHITELRNYIEVNRLHNHIRLLGLVPYEDVFALMKFSVAVINPSLFEGWSSTVEECKSVGKNMILSDLVVHKEQYPEAAFFEKNSVESLKDILSNYKVTFDISITNNIDVRTYCFAQNYLNVIKETIND